MVMLTVIVLLVSPMPKLTVPVAPVKSAPLVAVPLSLRDWGLMLVISALPLVFMEIYKPLYALVRRIRHEPEDYFGVFPE